MTQNSENEHYKVRFPAKTDAASRACTTTREEVQNRVDGELA